MLTIHCSFTASSIKDTSMHFSAKLMFVVEISIENISLTYGDVSQKIYVGKYVTFFRGDVESGFNSNSFDYLQCTYFT